MTISITKIRKPQRWDTPFAEDSQVDVDRLMSIEPFRRMDAEAFSNDLPLPGILQNDCRINQYSAGEIVLREGDYGNSAFLILSGELLVSLGSVSAEILGRHRPRKKSFFESLSQLWKNSRFPETRDYSKSSANQNLETRTENQRTRVFIQDIPRVLDLANTETLVEGEFFGELAALTRTPRTATVIAKGNATVLEIRWQGLRDLMKRDRALRTHIDNRYRQYSLKAHLRETELLQNLPESEMEFLVNSIEFETYGNFDWHQQFKSTQQKDIADQIHAEPVIAEKGDYVNGLILIRNGFARLSRPFGNGHQTIAYLGKGDAFGLRELTHNWRTREQRNWMLSLRAIGYVDVLRIPTSAVENYLLPHLDPNTLPPPLPPRRHDENTDERRQLDRDQTLQTDMLEFLMDHRFINGTQAMMIDMNRCTRCDDCVTACAATHNNNPRFSRTGPIQNGLMIAGACMHCVDPVCMIGCPTGAIGRDQTTGHVIINDATCIGCGTCAGSCPYNNIKMVHVRDRKGNSIVDSITGQPIEKATKCDLCSEQLGGPACQRACPHDALVRIDLSKADELTNWLPK